MIWRIQKGERVYGGLQPHPPLNLKKNPGGNVDETKLKQQGEKKTRDIQLHKVFMFVNFFYISTRNQHE